MREMMKGQVKIKLNSRRFHFRVFSRLLLLEDYEPLGPIQDFQLPMEGIGIHNSTMDPRSNEIGWR